MKYSIDEIIEMLASNDKSIQQKGIEAASEVKTLKCFMRPPYGNPKNCTWKNCAKIVSARSDEELKYYITDLVIWISNVDNLGYDDIFYRLMEFKDKALLEKYISHLINENLKEFLPYGFEKIINNIDLSLAEDSE